MMRVAAVAPFLLFLFAVALLGPVLAGGSEGGAGDPADAEAVERGRAIYSDTQGIEYPSCAQCHALVPEAAEEDPKRTPHLGPGGTLWGSARREGWRNMNTYKNVADASDYCAKNWQQRKGGLNSEQKRDLLLFLATQAPAEGTLPKREVQKTPKLPKDLSDLEGGDAAKGEKLTERFCGGCHSASDEALSFELKPGKKKSELIARKTRGYDARGKFKPQDGTMSYYTNDRLTDEDLSHILAYLGR